MYQVVQEVNGVLKYPPGLPGDRPNTTLNIWLGGVCLTFVAITSVLVHDKVNSYRELFMFPVVAVASGVSCLGCLCLLAKSFLYIEESNYLLSRHGGDLVDLAKKAYIPNMPSCMLLACSIAILQFNGWKYPLQYGIAPLVSAFSVSYFLLQWTQMEWSSLQLWGQLGQMKGLDYGSGMAYSFFWGYLNIVLPSTGDMNKGIVERINVYIAQEGLSDVQFPVKKLIILIPSSAYIPTTLVEHAPDGMMLTAKSLEDQQFHVAGVQNRVYKNSVYKIRKSPANDPKPEYIYVVAEGATPLKTLHQVVNSNGTSGYAEYQSELIHLFYKTLRQLIREDDRVRNLCELIYYVDKDSSGAPVNVAEIILQRVHELESKKRI